MKLEYQAILWVFVLLAPIIAFVSYVIIYNIPTPTFWGVTLSSKTEHDHLGPNNALTFGLFIFEGLWIAGIACIMFWDEPREENKTQKRV